MSRACVRRATCIATWAQGLPKPWNTVSAGLIVRASAITNHSSIVQLVIAGPPAGRERAGGGSQTGRTVARPALVVSSEQFLPRGVRLGPAGHGVQPVRTDRGPVPFLTVADIGVQVFRHAVRPGLCRG